MVDLGQLAQQNANYNNTLKQQGQDLFNSDTAQVNQSTNAYNTAQAGANTAQGDLQNFTKNMQSGTDMYNKALGTANANSGYNVNDLNNAQGQVSQLTGVLGGLPRAVQASNANYGATAGNVASQLSTEGANLNQSLGLANQNAANQIAKMQGGLTGAQASTSSGLQGQQQQLQGYTSTAQNAVSVMDQARQTMASWAQIAQQQGGLNAQQAASAAASQQSFAAAQQAYAQAAAASAQAASTNYATDQARQTNDYQQAHQTGAYAPAAPQPQTPAQPQNNGNWFDNSANWLDKNVNNPIGNWWNSLPTSSILGIK